MQFMSVGEMVIDFLPGTEKNSYIAKAGGAPANVAIAMARLGCEASFCGMMGDDHFGRFLMDTLRENNVHICNPNLTPEAITTMAFVSLDENGDRSFTFARKPGADMLLTKNEIIEEDILKTLILHAGSCSLSQRPASDATKYAMQLAHEKGKIVSFDVNYRNLMWNDDIDAASKAVFDVLEYVDFLKISEEEADMLGGEKKLPECIKKYGISLLMETLGSKGARCYFKDKIIDNPGLKANAVDTCGAGDAFWGGFLATILKENIHTTEDLNEDIIKKAMRTGNIAGWLCVQKKGAIESLPLSSDVERIQREMFK